MTSKMTARIRNKLIEIKIQHGYWKLGSNSILETEDTGYLNIRFEYNKLDIRNCLTQYRKLAYRQ